MVLARGPRYSVELHPWIGQLSGLSGASLRIADKGAVKGPRRAKVGGKRRSDRGLRLVRGDLTIQVNINDHLDIYCPHYPHGTSVSPPETLALYQVAEGQFRGCVKTEGAIKRWECNRPYAPFGPVLFSEKIQKHSPFSKGLEFLPGHHYYYSCES
ncbi:hypothetical protein Z043_116597 [Scleropages formosus]|uniref:Ephrin RBD domain-containing protein n=1 Tax=Scleropages formosus TaxID=113540 RepID=A0A0P7USQ0_SCLFO|nr:hypothetical protein Z043_116597 [Scleropages formosus]